MAFIDVLKKRRKSYVMKKDLIHRGFKSGSAFDIQILSELIKEYDCLIKLYHNHENTDSGMDNIHQCRDCRYCVIYDHELDKMFCSKVKGKSIIFPNKIQEWCPIQKKRRGE